MRFGRRSRSGRSLSQFDADSGQAVLGGGVGALGAFFCSRDVRICGPNFRIEKRPPLRMPRHYVVPHLGPPRGPPKWAPKIALSWPACDPRCVSPPSGERPPAADESTTGSGRGADSSAGPSDAATHTALSAGRPRAQREAPPSGPQPISVPPIRPLPLSPSDHPEGQSRFPAVRQPNLSGSLLALFATPAMGLWLPVCRAL